MLSDEISGKIGLYNSTGLLETIKQITGNVTAIPINNLPNGNYIVRIVANGKVISKKVIIQ